MRAVILFFALLCETFEKRKRNFSANGDTKIIVDNKTFWQTLKVFFSDKTLDPEQITLTKNG